MEEKMIAIKKIIAVGGVLLGTVGVVHAYLRMAPFQSRWGICRFGGGFIEGNGAGKGSLHRNRYCDATRPCPTSSTPLRISRETENGLHEGSFSECLLFARKGKKGHQYCVYTI